MSQLEKAPDGLALMCNRHGVVMRVVRDELDLGERVAPGTALVELVDAASIDKMCRFLEEVRVRGAAFDWQITVHLAEELVVLHFVGVLDNEEMFVVAGRSSSSTTRFYDEMMRMHNEQGAALRSALKVQASSRPESDIDPARYNELTRLNNELANMQRELAQKNAELQRAGEEIARKQAQLVDANARLEVLASLDGLTQVLNRRAFMEALETAVTRAAKDNLPLSLFMLDVDHFKQYNDSFGHVAGDEALQRVAQLMKDRARADDVLGRYGGEEFIVLLVGADRDDALAAGEALRARIAAVKQLHRPITASVGVVTQTAAHHTATALIDAADRALYHAKETGRDRVVHADDLQTSTCAR